MVEDENLNLAAALNSEEGSLTDVGRQQMQVNPVDLMVVQT